jgi:multicomponent Na+:H+ antiporter subunit E
MSKGVRAFLLLAALLAFHAGLSGAAQLHNFFLMGMGVLGCSAVTALAWRMGILDDEGLPIEYWLRTALYVPWLIWQIVLANIDVAKRVWNPDLPIAPRMIRVPHKLETPYGVATYINSITLTPGTVTIDVGDGQFLVHALTKEAADDVLAGAMHDRIKAVENTK